MDQDHRFPKTWKEARRKRAFELKQHGWKQKDIAEAFAVSPAAVSQWLAKAQEDGVAAWRAKPRPTGPIKLTDAQLRLIPELLSHGAEAYGFRGELWTCARVAVVIWEEFGVSYHKAHVSRLLKRLRWTPQLPIERAVQRDEALIKQWRIHVWPELKKRHVQKGGPLSLWTSLASISCQGGSARTRHVDRHQYCGGHIPAIMCR
jgi:transposase